MIRSRGLPAWASRDTPAAAATTSRTIPGRHRGGNLSRPVRAPAAAHRGRWAGGAQRSRTGILIQRKPTGSSRPSRRPGSGLLLSPPGPPPADRRALTPSRPRRAVAKEDFTGRIFFVHSSVKHPARSMPQATLKVLGLAVCELGKDNAISSLRVAGNHCPGKEFEEMRRWPAPARTTNSVSNC